MVSLIIYHSYKKVIPSHKISLRCWTSRLDEKREISHGGRSIKRLSELEDFGFIQSFISKGHKEKGKYYKVIDEYILFYLHWIEPNLKQASQNKKI